MRLNTRMRQLFDGAFSSLLKALIAIHCLNFNVNTPVSRFPWKGKVSYQFNTTTAQKHSCSYAGSINRSTPYVYSLVLGKVMDEQVYAPDKMQGKASNSKRNLSLARNTIVTA